MNRIINQDNFTIDLERVASIQLIHQNDEHIIEVQYNGRTEFVYQPEKEELVERIIIDKVSKSFSDFDSSTETYQAIRECWEMYLA